MADYTRGYPSSAGGGANPGYGEDTEKPIDYKYYWFLLKKNFYVIVTFFIMTVTVAFIYTSKTPQGYRAVSQVIIDRPDDSAWKTDVESEQGALDSPFSIEYYKTQMAIILGSGVLRQVVDELKLDTYFETKTPEAAIHQLRKMVQVERVDDSRIFRIKVTATDPVLAANVANTVSRAYIRKNFEDMLYYSREIMTWLPQTGPENEKITIEDPLGGVKQMTRQELVDSLPSIRTNTTIRQLTEKKATLEADLKLLLSQYREKHPNIIKARANLKFIEDSIKNEKQRVIDSLKVRAEGTLHVSHARILEEAEIPKSPLPSSKNKIIVVAAVVELLVSCFLIFLLDYFDDTIHTMEDLERKGLVIPFLGPLPIIKEKTLMDTQKGVLVYQNPKSEIAESFRYLRVSINFSASPESLKTLIFISCLPHEGKSFVAQNTAASLAIDGNRTLLVDADLRRPTVHRNFKLDNTSGLSNFLTSKIDYESIIKESYIEDLHVVTSGPSSPNPGAILGSDRMKEFLEISRKRYDRVILDCPPLTGIGDGLILGSIVGHMILVIAAWKTPLDLIRHTQGLINKAGIQIIGAVLNFVDMEKERYHGYSKYYYHTYNRYYRVG